MSKFLKLFALSLFVSVCFLVSPLVDYADAARMGGGRSFGGSSSYSRPTTMPSRTNTQMAPRTAGQQRSAQSAATGGILGGTGLGRWLGPMLVGSALGALLFGGAFSGITMMDIVVVGLILYILTRFLRPRSTATQSSTNVGGFRRGQTDASSSSGHWEHLKTAPAAGGASSVQEPETLTGDSLPAGFDREEFLEGSKVLFNRLQGSWDKRDFDDIGEFCTPAMLALLEEQGEEDPEPSQTDVLMVEADMFGYATGTEGERASVFFSALLREYAGRQPEQVYEVWHFIRANKQAMWRLDGIQQVVPA